MPLYQRQDIAKLLSEIKDENIRPVYLICGERYLCRDVADKLVQHLLPDEKERSLNLKRIDGEQEDVAHTMAHLQTYSLFAGRQVIRVMDSKLFSPKRWQKTCGTRQKKQQVKATLKKRVVFCRK